MLSMKRAGGVCGPRDDWVVSPFPDELEMVCSRNVDKRECVCRRSQAEINPHTSRTRMRREEKEEVLTRQIQ